VVKHARYLLLIVVAVAALIFACASEATPQYKDIPGIACHTPPLQQCGANCNAATVDNHGNAYEPKSGRAFFLDYPCDLTEHEKVLFILNLHGAGATGDWQRHYFPASDYKEKYRLVIATPTAATEGHIAPIPFGFRVWDSAADDGYLEDIVNFVAAQFGRKNIKAFWLAGHSQGGVTANRIVCNDFFKEIVDGWLSLSGGRIGAVVPSRKFDSVQTSSPDNIAANFGEAFTPTCNISYIFVSGEREIVSLPETSPWADKYKCASRVQVREVVDSELGYVTSGTHDSIGRMQAPPPHAAKIFVYPRCKKGKLVADVLRLDRDHDDGLGANVTAAIIELMKSAPGGKAKEVSWRD
jgi:hypothetical protein